jgi:hypothetical protein
LPIRRAVESPGELETKHENKFYWTYFSSYSPSVVIRLRRNRNPCISIPDAGSPFRGALAAVFCGDANRNFIASGDRNSNLVADPNPLTGDKPDLRRRK